MPLIIAGCCSLRYPALKIQTETLPPTQQRRITGSHEVAGYSPSLWRDLNFLLGDRNSFIDSINAIGTVHFIQVVDANADLHFAEKNCSGGLRRNAR